MHTFCYFVTLSTDRHPHFPQLYPQASPVIFPKKYDFSTEFTDVFFVLTC